MQNDAGVEEEEEEEEETENKNFQQKGQSLIMSREAIREAKKRERQAERKKSGKKGKNNSGKKSAGKKNQNNKNNIWINNRSNNRVKGLSKSEEDEMRFNFNQNMLTF